ncbi:lactoylglutathione lyase [bacterium]|nr:lactoylglutathione lyase [bacterium]
MMMQFEFSSLSKSALYESLNTALSSLLSAESDFHANLANTAALLYWNLPDVNWAGFYLLKSDELLLAPFQGKLACTRIKLGRGVCGTAALKNETILVPDVEAFPGHIACDSASRSEIVIPINIGGKLLGVLDVDSPTKDRFDETDRQGLEKLVSILVEKLSLHERSRFLHTMIRVGDLNKSIDFYTRVLGFELVRKSDYPDDKFTLAFLRVRAGTSDEPELELTYNWGVENYDLGKGYGHIALAVSSLKEFQEKIRREGWDFSWGPSTTPSGKGGMAFIKDPDGYSIELLEGR